MTLPAPPLDHARRAVLDANALVLRLVAAKYRRRLTLRRIDDVLELVELANVAGDTTPPAAAMALLAELDQEHPAPRTALKAHAALFALQRRYMRTSWYDGDPVDREDADDQIAGHVQ